MKDQTITVDAFSFGDDKDAFIELLFSQSLDGFFFMMLDEPVRWDDTVDKDAVLAHVFDHQRLVKANDALLEQYGATREDMLNLTPGDFFAHDLAAGQEIWRRLFDRGRLHIETHERRLDETSMWIVGDYICLYDDQGRITGHFGIQHDITESKQAEEALRESERKTRALLESASESIVIVNQRGAIELVNARTEEMFGYGRAELLGHPLSKLIPQKVRGVHAQYCATYFESPRARPMGIGLELLGERKDGSQIPLEISLSAVQTADGLLALAFVTDITDRVEAEQALKAYSERLEEMVDERTKELREAQTQLLERQRLQQEVELAAQVQKNLLPSKPPEFEGFDLCARALPARYVSGDLYDFFLPSDTTCHIILADVSGKGIPAALLASTARTLMRAATAHDESPATILAHLNRSFYPDLASAEQFITLTVARLDVQTGNLCYASAGHTQTLCFQRTQRTCRKLSATGLPIGILEDVDFTEETLFLQPGDVVLFYSDGISEASNEEGELFGVDRLAHLVCAHANEEAESIAQRIIEAVEGFRSDGYRSDDVTLVILKAQPRTVNFAYPADLDHLHRIISTISTAVASYGDDFAYQMELAASEIVTNIIKHSYAATSGQVRGAIHLDLDRVTVDLYDDGASFDWAEVPAPDMGEPQVGGYGLLIAEQTTDELTYVPGSPQGNHWRLLKSLEGE